jgi:RES domain-containing protein
MNLYRIAKNQYINDISGEGARIYGGRWNRPGLAVLYTSEARSLALLELIVHFTSKKSLQYGFSFLNIEIDDFLIETVDKNSIPKTNINPNDNRLWQITDYYFKEKNCLAIRVPSVLIPQEYNVILNTQHIDYKQVEIKKTEEINLDERFKIIL